MKKAEKAKTVVVEILVYDTHGVDDGLVKEFSSLKEALDYVFEDLENSESVELMKSSLGEYVFIPKDYGRHIEYRISAGDEG